MKQKDKLKVLIIAAEAAPYVKSGGLGDVVGSLPKELRKLDIDVRIVVPKYKTIKNENFVDAEYLGDFNVKLGWRTQKCGVLFKNGEVPVYFIENDYYFSRDSLYGYDDDNERFAFFSKSTCDMMPFVDFIPDIVHLNDWQTGAVPLILREAYKKITYFRDIKILYTIHNLQYQGNFSSDMLEMLDLPSYHYENGDLEFYGRFSFMKAGIIYSDIISTVSETYAKEIQTEEFGYGFDGIIRTNNYKLKGILNGIDYDANNPKTDKRIEANFDENSIEKKKENKTKLQETLGLEKRDVPLIAMISRLADQKGLDILADSIESVMNNDIQFVVLGTGEKQYEDMCKGYEARWKGRFCACIMFDDVLAQQIYASSDMFLMPSKFEPCGLGQIFALRYGSIPVVRKTGGIADTIQHFDLSSGNGNGFLFESYDGEGIIWAVNEALRVYYDDEKRYVLIKNCMSTKLSWQESAKKYALLYKEMLNN